MPASDWLHWIAALPFINYGNMSQFSGVSVINKVSHSIAIRSSIALGDNSY